LIAKSSEITSESGWFLDGLSRSGIDRDAAP